MEARTALVLGATGGLGGAVAGALTRRGWQVRALHRRAAEMVGRDGLTWVAGDAMARDSVAAAAAGAALIVHAVNPPGYRRWEELSLPMLDNTIAAAAQSGARILFPGNVYNFGADAGMLLAEDSPQNPVTRKGKVRVAMERRLAQSGLPVLVVRMGDFFGPRAGSNWFAQALVKPGRPVRSIGDPGTPGVGHQWAYLPDVAETMLRLVETVPAARFESFHMEGQWDANGTGMAEAIRAATGRPGLAVRRFPWTLVSLAAPVVPLFRELVEMRYLWQEPIRMTNAKLEAAIGPEPRTPLVEAVRATLAGLGCLPDAPAAAPRAQS